MKVLIVEDDSSKVTEISKILREFEGRIDEDVVLDIKNATEKLQKNKYDLLILDINLPNRLGESPIEGNGASLLDRIKNNEKFLEPSYVVGLTAYEDEWRNSDDIFKSNFTELIRYDISSEQWKDNLRRKIERFLSKENTIFFHREEYNYDYAIITALRYPELEAFLQICTEREEINIPGDPASYFKVSFGDKNQKILLATNDTMGMIASSHLSEKVIQSFRPRFLLMGGIAAGIEGRSNFGDVLVANTSWNYESGKYIESNGKSLFEPSFKQININVNLEKILKKEVPDEIFSSFQRWGDKGHSKVSVKLGPIASGSSVVSDTKITERIKSSERKLIGVEMEIFGMYYSATNSSDLKPTFLAAKSVCDYANNKKSDDFQEYAAKTSAAYIKYLICDNVISDLNN
ncbi:phosphorylase family protein [Lactococcus lactis]